ncbi:MAG: hypothetical protein QOJ66_163, partial [Ilumatobacteraceae bacterium]
LASIAPGTGAVSESTGWQRAVDAVAKAGLVRIDTGSSSRLSMTALCELVGLVRAARRLGVTVDLRPPSDALTEQLRSIGLATYLVDSETNR